MSNNQELLDRLKRRPNAYHAHLAFIKIAPDAVLVGGAVRDLLLDRDIHDLDYVLTDNAIAAARWLGNELGGAYYPLDERRGIGRVVWQIGTGDRLVIDVSDLRGNSLDDDLRARDFTINAIALGADGLYDPLAGIDDLAMDLLRTCTSDSLQADPVRILRAVRFVYQFRLQVDVNLVDLIGAAMPGLSSISPERQRDELLKILALPEPQQALNTLHTWGLEQRYFPKLTDLLRIEQSPPHIYNAYQHSLITLRWMSRIEELYRLSAAPIGPLETAILDELASFHDKLQEYLNHLLVSDHPRWLWLRFAALAHDWGKTATVSQDEDGRIRFLGHEAISAELAGNWLELYHCASSEIEFVRRVCKGHMRPLSLSEGGRMPSRRSLYRFYRDLGDAAPGVILLHIADYLATYGPAIDLNDLHQHLKFVSAMLEPMNAPEEGNWMPKALLNGNDLIRMFGLEPGPPLGELLEALREAQVVDEVNSREDAVEWMQQRLG